MANSLKIKIGIAAFAILILVMIPLLETKFFAPVTVKRWGKVSWDDFQGIPQPFSTYEAGISSSIYLEYDSTKDRYVAYAGQNNVQSWAKRSQEEQDYLLNHEQYHFNITELHARMLNDYIEENPDGTLQLYLLRLGSLNIDLRRMQRQYDNETNHSLVYDKQRRWEYRIDSLLTRDAGWVIDKYSGAKAFFPDMPNLNKGISESGNKYRFYSLNRYDVAFTLSSFQNSSFPADMLNNIVKSYSGSGKSLKLVSVDSSTTHVKTSVIYEDTTGHTSYVIWLKDSSYVYGASAKFPNNYGDTTGYSLIAKSFVNSFSVVSTDDHWIQTLEKSSNTINFYNVKNHDGVKEKGTKYCIGIGPSRELGFYRGPFYRDDGAMFLAFDYLLHPDTLHFKDVLLLDKDWYSHTPTPDGQIYFVPAKSVPKEPFTIKFGYILNQDSSKECYEFYHQQLAITPTCKGTLKN